MPNIEGRQLLAEPASQSTAPPQTLLPQQYGNSYGYHQQQPVHPQQTLQSSLGGLPAIQPMTAQEKAVTHRPGGVSQPASSFNPPVSGGHQKTTFYSFYSPHFKL